MCFLRFLHHLLTRVAIICFYIIIHTFVANKNEQNIAAANNKTTNIQKNANNYTKIILENYRDDMPANSLFTRNFHTTLILQEFTLSLYAYITELN